MESDITRLEAQILQYLDAHPHAADTAEGIAVWWLKSDPRTRLSRVQKALENLVQNNNVTRRKSPDGHILYSKGVESQENYPEAPINK
jgi:Fe2+ or Zn2+ uptake regulation protein